jgi:hypothetical protein
VRAGVRVCVFRFRRIALIAVGIITIVIINIVIINIERKGCYRGHAGSAPDRRRQYAGCG